MMLNHFASWGFCPIKEHFSSCGKYGAHREDRGQHLDLFSTDGFFLRDSETCSVPLMSTGNSEAPPKASLGEKFHGPCNICRYGTRWCFKSAVANVETFKSIKVRRWASLKKNLNILKMCIKLWASMSLLIWIWPKGAINIHLEGFPPCS